MSGVVLTLLAALSAIWCASGQESLPRDFPCTREEHECLSLGRLLNKNGGRCYPVDEYNVPCPRGQFFRANKTLALMEGRLQGACMPPLCSTNEIFAADTGRCEDYFDFFKKICGGKWKRRYNVWGEAVCTDSEDDKYSKRQNDTWNGRCSPPQRMIPAPAPEYLNILSGATIPCTLQEYQCYQRNEVFFRGECWPLRIRGPCAEGEWLVLDKNAVQISEYGTAEPNYESRIVPICARRPCRPKHVLPTPGSVAGETCTPISFLRRRICSGLVLALDVFGRVGCISYDTFLYTSSEFPQAFNRDQCYTPIYVAAAVGSSGTDCARGDDGYCIPDMNLLKSRVGTALLEDD